MSNTMYTGRIFDALVIANGTPATSAAVRMDNAITMSIATQVATTAGSVNVAYSYELSSNKDSGFTAPTSPSSIATATALDIADFSPEASKWIRIIATNGDAADVTLTSVLNIQEAA